ncbi:hypothetical protein HGRIS_008417 [Hohenbuehelia grisea]|uniref:Uncharacterized protein n=1 Tax=Hohenbuehelia grisea TaxID=104357 RepID=A0ABR3J9C5_9AGAR
MLTFFTILLALSATMASPTRRSEGFDPQNQLTRVTKLGLHELGEFLTFTLFAKAVYCPSEKISPNWDCGIPCKRLSSFKATLTGGDGGSVQFFFVGYWDQDDAIVVSHQGTDPTSLDALLTDANVFPRSLNPRLFPNVSSEVQVHGGFASAHEQTADQILEHVQEQLRKTKAKKVYIVSLAHCLSA